MVWGRSVTGVVLLFLGSLYRQIVMIYARVYLAVASVIIATVSKHTRYAFH